MSQDLLSKRDSFTLPRWVLYAIYLILAGQGVALGFADSIAVPKLGLADYLIPYGAGIAVLSVLSLWAAMRRWEWLECVSTFFLFAGLTTFVSATLLDWFQDVTDRGALGIVTILVVLLPLARSVVLFRNLIWRHAVGRK